MVCRQVTGKCHAVLCNGLEHLQVWVPREALDLIPLRHRKAAERISPGALKKPNRLPVILTHYHHRKQGRDRMPARHPRGKYVPFPLWVDAGTQLGYSSWSSC